MAGVTEGLTFRKATAADSERIGEIIAGEPSQEAVGLTGDAERARRLGMALARMPNSPQGWQHTVVAELDGEVVGIIQAGADISEFRVTAAIASLAIRVLGPLRVLAMVPRFRARGRVQPRHPGDSYYVAELDVDPQYRNRGIGAALLRYAEEEARNRGHRQMALSTTTANPARRLYERHGFRVIETRTDPDYERYTGAEGRILMVKELAQR